MKYLNKLLTATSVAFFIAGSALAQTSGTVSNHAFALGKGAGTIGYTSLLCGSAQLAVGQSAADPICQTITGDVTISAAGVTAIGTAKVTVTMLSAPGIDTNVSTSKVANYTAANADCGAPILLGGNALFTLTINAANTYSTNCKLVLINTDVYTGSGSGRGKVIAANGLTTFILYPGQKQELRQSGSSWIPEPGPLSGAFGQVWKAPAGVTFFVDNGGSNTVSDGLASGAAGSFQTLAKCASQAYSVVYTRNFSSVICSPTSGQTFQESFQVLYPMNGGGTLLFSGNGGAFTWKPTNSNYALQFGDGALVGLTNVTFSSAGVTTPLGFVAGHNLGVLDVNTGVSLTPTVSLSSGFLCDYDTHFNINNGLTVNAGTFSKYVYEGCQGSSWNINGTQTFVGTPTFGRYAVFISQSVATFQGNVTFSGATSTSATFVSDNSVLNNFTGIAGSLFPGGTPVVASGGQVCTSAGTCVPNTPVSALTGLGTGVGTALGVNVGSAGAPVVNGGALGTPTAAGSSLANLLCVPVVTVFTSGTDATFTPTTCNSVLPLALEIEMVGGGGGGAGSGTASGAATNGGPTCWKASGAACTTPIYQAGNGLAGTTSGGAIVAGGTVSGSGTCDDGMAGSPAGAPTNQALMIGTMGGSSRYGGGGGNGFAGAGGAAVANSGSGGGGAGSNTAPAGGGGSSGAFCGKLITPVSSSYVYTIGAAGTGGTLGTGGGAGGNGAAGRLKIKQLWQ